MAPYRKSQLMGSMILLTIVTWVGWNFRHTTNPVQVVPISTQPDRIPPAHLDTRPPAQEDVSAPDESDIVDTLCHYGVCNVSPDAEITYGRIDLEVIEDSSFTAPLLQDIDSRFPVLESLDSSTKLTKPSFSTSRATVQVAMRPEPVDASNMMFGVATNIDRLEDSLDQFAHWASGNGVQFVALVPNTSLPDAIDRTMAKSRSLQLNLKVLNNGMSFNDRYFHLGSLMHEHATPSTTWTAFIDDDTFFPSMHKLQAMLSNFHNPKTKGYYVGTISEDLHQLFKWGYMAYGGGGVFLSIGLLNELSPHLEECASLSETGDARIAQCIYRNTITKFSPGPGLFQLDLWGDVTGFYEALRPQPVSVHHWKSWHRFNMVNVSKVSTISGDASIFQKYKLADDWQLTNGFSIVKYSEGNERHGDDVRMEKTFLDSEGGTLDMFLHSVAPLRSKDENKIQYVIEGSKLENGVVRQFYVKRHSQEGERPTVQILEVAWKRKKV